jgi:hypothetical protein
MKRNIVASCLALAAGIGLNATLVQAATPNDPTQAALATAMSQVATSFIQDYWAQWSMPNAQAIPYMRQDFASTVNFFGKDTSRDAILKNTSDFANRWQIRNYTITPHDAAHPNRGITSVNCNVVNSTCVVSGVVHWDAQAPGPQLQSQGDAKFSFTLALNGGQTLITAETSSVVWRKLTPLSQVAATAPPSNTDEQPAQATQPQTDEFSDTQDTVHEDYIAQSLANEANAGDAEALASLNKNAKINPAFLYGIYDFYDLKYKNLGVVLLESTLLDQKSDPIYDEFHPEDAAKMTAMEEDGVHQHPEASALYNQMLPILVKASDEHDPAAEASLALEYWTEISFRNTIYSLLYSTSDAPPLQLRVWVVQIEGQDGGSEFQVEQDLCKEGLKLALASRAAGWPGADNVISMYSLPANTDSFDSGYVARKLSEDAGCIGQDIPGSEGTNRNLVHAQATVSSPPPLLSGQVSDATMNQVEADLAKLMNEGGAHALSSADQDCYNTKVLGGKDGDAISYCLLLDAVAYQLDQGMRSIAGSEGTSLPAVTPFMTTEAYNSRQTVFADTAFGGSVNALNSYLGQAPGTVLSQWSNNLGNGQ